MLTKYESIERVGVDTENDTSTWLCRTRARPINDGHTFAPNMTTTILFCVAVALTGYMASTIPTSHGETMRYVLLVFLVVLPVGLFIADIVYLRKIPACVPPDIHVLTTTPVAFGFGSADREAKVRAVMDGIGSGELTDYRAIDLFSSALLHMHHMDSCVNYESTPAKNDEKIIKACARGLEEIYDQYDNKEDTARLVAAYDVNDFTRRVS